MLRVGDDIDMLRGVGDDIDILRGVGEILTY